MPDSHVELTVTDLISYADSQGYTVSEPQVEYWREKKLLPEGNRPGRGKGQGRGKRRYSANVAGQLVALCRARQGLGRLEDVGWCLWCDGWPVDEVYWRTPLEKAAEEFDKILLVIRNKLLDRKSDDLTEFGFTVAHQLKEKRIDNPLLKKARKRLSLGDMETFAQFAWRLAVGSDPFPASHNNEADLRDIKTVQAGLGLQRAATDRLPTGQTTLHGSIEASLMALSNDLSVTNAAAFIRVTPAKMIAEARDELFDLIKAMSSAGKILEQHYGPGAFGLGTVQTLLKQDKKSVAMLLAIWIFVGKESQLRRDAQRVITELGAAR